MFKSENDVSALPKEGPHIHGQEKTYQIGDTINLTCTSGKSYPPAKLKWFINNQEVSRFTVILLSTTITIYDKTLDEISIIVATRLPESFFKSEYK